MLKKLDESEVIDLEALVELNKQPKNNLRAVLFDCSFCDEKFTRKSYLKTHLNVSHDMNKNLN